MPRLLLCGVLAGPLLLAWVAPASARDAETASCRARLAGRRALADVELRGFFDADLLRLVRLGLAGRLEVELTVLRKRWFIVSASGARQRYRSVLTFDPAAQEFAIDGSAIGKELRDLTLERLSLPLEEPLSGAPLIRATARFEVVTESSLLQVAKWLAGGGRNADNRASGDAAPPDARSGRSDAGAEQAESTFSTFVFKSLMRDLARSATATCALER
jgi:hypothetical protein